MVEDDEKTAETLRWGLAEAGIPADVVHNGGDAIARSQENAYDVVLLDVMLPDGPDGFAVCRRLRDLRVPTRVMMLTARSGVSDRVSGLNSGADDYLTKPFAFAELLARIRALGRRDPAPGTAAVSDLVIDELARTARVGEARLPLTRKEFDLLALLTRQAGRVVSGRASPRQRLELRGCAQRRSGGRLHEPVADQALAGGVLGAHRQRARGRLPAGGDGCLTPSRPAGRAHSSDTLGPCAGGSRWPERSSSSSA